jgi:hypothetical protein
VHDMRTGWRGSDPWWTSGNVEKRRSGASSTQGVRAIQLIRAHRQRPVMASPEHGRQRRGDVMAEMSSDSLSSSRGH